MLNVYIDKISKYDFSSKVYPKERLSEILACKSEKVRNQKYASWKLLEYALKTSFNLNLNELNFTKTEKGKWECDKAHFSISHTDNLVCVAVSDSPIGVDVEKVRKINLVIKSKILAKEELETYSLIKKEDKLDYLFCVWTGKESVYKFSSQTPFIFTKFNLSSYPVKTDKITINCEDYYLSICCENIIKNNIKITLL